jgi:hypothetical protein
MRQGINVWEAVHAFDPSCSSSTSALYRIDFQLATEIHQFLQTFRHTLLAGFQDLELWQIFVLQEYLELVHDINVAFEGVFAIKPITDQRQKKTNTSPWTLKGTNPESETRGLLPISNIDNTSQIRHASSMSSASFFGFRALLREPGSCSTTGNTLHPLCCSRGVRLPNVRCIVRLTSACPIFRRGLLVRSYGHPFGSFRFSFERREVRLRAGVSNSGSAISQFIFAGWRVAGACMWGPVDLCIWGKGNSFNIFAELFGRQLDIWS